MESLRIVLADDHAIVRQGLRSLLEQQPGWKVVAEAVTGNEAVIKVGEFKPDVAILDISMPSLLILTIHDSDTMIKEMLDAGVRGYVLKSDAASDLVVAVEALQHNKTFFTSKVAEMVLDGYLMRVNNSAETEPAASRLTSRQREIVKLLAEGKTSDEVATTLGLSLKTAETHRSNIMKRLNCHSIGELVRYALRNQIINP
jgi:DNA-binding NarL/FixJ family response regulator